MAYSVDWVNRIITIPQSDLTLISGVNYSLDITDVHIEIRRLENDFNEGLWAAQVIDFKETVIVSGISKSPTVLFINNYQIAIGGSNINVFLSGPDSNLVDVFIPGNGVSIVGNNSVGKQQVGSGVTEQDKLDIADRVWNEVL